MEVSVFGQISVILWAEFNMEAENGEMKSKMDEYEVIKQLGKGAFGTTFLVLHKTDQKK